MLLVQMLASPTAGSTSALLTMLSGKHLQLPPAGFSTLPIAYGWAPALNDKAVLKRLLGLNAERAISG